ncbi:hypothetical protein [Bradyrhizobium sp. CCBAU 51765]|uniref:hypothetical protein n=1 Tax=Bradyrhizobium sp. CCBAU 51765 TaxID=1325102 RepID=UPI001887E00F|nr:hypothetical protein [Bradyrhizobium sp. CCBAU 51765]
MALANTGTPQEQRKMTRENDLPQKQADVEGFVFKPAGSETWQVWQKLSGEQVRVEETAHTDSSTATTAPEFHNLPPELGEPPKEARGWIAFQPATGKAWRKIAGKWLPIVEANALIEARKSR